MTGKTHAACGLTTMAVITATHLSGIDIAGHTYQPAIGLFSVVVGSYMPDIDIQRSHMGKRHKIVSKMLTHRGITHTLLIPTVLLIAMLAAASNNIPVLPELVLGFNIGWVLHIVADLFNKKGVPLFWPILRKKVHIARVLTGSWQETLFLILWIGVNVLWAYSRFL